ncbi:MAG: ATP-binding protein [Olegusella sp.]|nr:ATP-binding protein [Olegusella sp.]
MSATGEWTGGSVYEAVSESAARVRITLPPAELAALAEERGIGEEGLGAVAEVFGYLAERQHEATIQTLLRLSRLPQRAPKTFDNFDFGRIRGRDADALRDLRTLSNLHSSRNIAFVGPGGIGKTHLAQAYGRACCLAGYKTYYLKASELRDRLQRAVETGTEAKAVAFLVKPSCLIVDEIGRCVLDRACTDLFFDVVDRRYERETPNTMVLTSNTPVNNWDEFFMGDTETLVCTLDRIFDRASVFMMRGPSFRGADCERFSVEAVPSVSRVRQ